MNRWRRINCFVDRVLSPFRKSRRSTISALLPGLLRKQPIGLSNIARGMRDATTVKHRVKRIGRFFSNPGVIPELATFCLVPYLLRKDHLNVIAVDWTDLGDYMLLKVSLVYRRRALPLAWQHVWKWHYEKSQNDEEEKLIAHLNAGIEPDYPWVLLADRGFGRTELFRWLDDRGIEFIIRVSGTAWIEHPHFSGTIDHVPRCPNHSHRYRRIQYRKERPVRTNLVVHHREPAPEPWYLVTNGNRAARSVGRLYAQRMRIEEGIRDCKSGFGFKHLQLSHPGRMDRAFLLVALAIILLALAAAASVARGDDLKLSTRKRPGPVLSFFSLGLRILEQYPHLLSINRRTLYAKAY